jgi:hypothetical protein
VDSLKSELRTFQYLKFDNKLSKQDTFIVNIGTGDPVRNRLLLVISHVLLLTLQMPRSPYAVAQPDLIILQHADMSEVMPLRVDQYPTATEKQ